MFLADGITILLAIVATLLIAVISILVIKNLIRRSKEATEKESAAKELNQILLEAAPFTVNLWNEKHEFVSTSHQSLEMFGMSSTEMYIEQFYNLLPKYQPDGRPSKEAVKEALDTAFREGRSQFEWMYQTVEGEPLPTEVTLVRFTRQGEQMVAAYTVDLRPIKAAEALTRKLLDNSPLFMEFWDLKNNMLDCNQKMLEVFGLANKAEVTEKFFELSKDIQPGGSEAKVKNAEMIKLAVENGSSRSEWTYILPSGEELPVEATWVHVIHQGEPMIIVYSQDLRPIKEENLKMQEEMRLRGIAEDESQAKTRFLAHMSHEIRTPMNAVLGIAEIQLQKEGHTPEVEDAFSRIHNSANLLLNIINEILDLARIEAGKMEIIPDVYGMESLIVDAVQLNLMYIGSNIINFELSVDHQLPANLLGDELRIKQILNNLLSNAFKYTAEGTVRLSFGLEESKVSGFTNLVLVVSDTGMGMDEEQIQDLFGEFNRFNVENNRGIQGSGLGMSIVYSLVNMMNGTIHVESQVGKGSSFTVRLPQEIYGEDILGEVAAAELQDLKAVRMNLKNMSRRSHEQMPYGRVLVVDDVETNLYVAEGLLNAYSIQVDTADSGQEAIQKIKRGKVYDIIFMDHMMPGMDGIEATKIIREMGYDRPIIALTANALKNMAELFLSSGFSGFVSKPIDVNKMDAYLIRFIRDVHMPELAGSANTATDSDEAKGGKGGKKHSALDLSDRMIDSFLRDAKKSYGILGEVYEANKFSEDELKRFTIQAHAIKSALTNVGLIEHADIALILEQAGKVGDIEIIKEKTPAFLTQLKEAMESFISHNIAQAEDINEDLNFIKEQLNSIKNACEIYDIDTINAALDALDKAAVSGDTKMHINEIAAYILQGDFEEAAAYIENYNIT